MIPLGCHYSFPCRKKDVQSGYKPPLVSATSKSYVRARYEPRSLIFWDLTATQEKEESPLNILCADIYFRSHCGLTPINTDVKSGNLYSRNRAPLIFSKQLPHEALTTPENRPSLPSSAQCVRKDEWGPAQAVDEMEGGESCSRLNI